MALFFYKEAWTLLFDFHLLQHPRFFFEYWLLVLGSCENNFFCSFYLNFCKLTDKKELLINKLSLLKKVYKRLHRVEIFFLFILCCFSTMVDFLSEFLAYCTFRSFPNGYLRLYLSFFQMYWVSRFVGCLIVYSECLFSLTIFC